MSKKMDALREAAALCDEYADMAKEAADVFAGRRLANRLRERASEFEAVLMAEDEKARAQEIADRVAEATEPLNERIAVLEHALVDKEQATLLMREALDRKRAECERLIVARGQVVRLERTHAVILALRARIAARIESALTGVGKDVAVDTETKK